MDSKGPGRRQERRKVTLQDLLGHRSERLHLPGGDGRYMMCKGDSFSEDEGLARSLLLIASVAGLVLLLAGAASWAAWLLGGLYTGDTQAVIGSESEGEVITRPGVFLEKELAAEAPRVPLDVGGLLLRREDNRLFVGTGNLSGFLVGGDTLVEAHWELHHDGPIAEVITTHGTVIYRDDTFRHLRPGALSSPVRQVLTATTLDQISGNSTVEAWGEWRGDRLVADVVVFYPNG